MRNLNIGIVCNVKRDPDDESQGEFDEPYTVEKLRSVIGSLGYGVSVIEADTGLSQRLDDAHIDFAFNIAEGLRGRGREAYAPAVLEAKGIPYLGSDVTTLSMGLDKDLTKRVVSSYGVRVPKSFRLKGSDRSIPEDVEYPVIVKPDAEGSSKGIHDDSVAQDRNELEGILSRSGYPDLLVEQYVDGREFTVGVIGNGGKIRVFEPMEVIYSKLRGKYRVYSYEVKKDFRRYISYKCPADVPAEVSEELKRMAKMSYLALSCRDFGRFDFRLSEDGIPYFIEANPLPGLAPGYSDYPMLAGFNGVTYDELIRELLYTALERNGIGP